MAFSQNDLSQEVTSMTVDELREVLDDVVNHQKPKSEKCSLVRRLTEEASKDELSPHGHFLHSSTGTHSRRKLRGSTASSITPSLAPSSVQPSNSSSQSLQDLPSGRDLASEKDLASERGPSDSLKSCPSGTNTRILNKAMRANSFSLASNSTCPQTVSEVSQIRSSSASGGGTQIRSSSASDGGTWTVQTSRQKEKSNISTRTLSSSATSSSFNSDFSDPVTLNSSYFDVNSSYALTLNSPYPDVDSSYPDVDSSCPDVNSSYPDVNDKNNNNDCDREQLAEGPSGDPSTNHHHAFSSASSLKTFSHHSSYLPEDSQQSAFKNDQQSQLVFKNDQQSQSVFKSDQQSVFKNEELFENAIEMQDFRRKAKYVQYNSSNTNSGDNTVDSVVQFSDLTTREPEDPQYARRIQIESGDGLSKSRFFFVFFGFFLSHFHLITLPLLLQIRVWTNVIVK